MIAAMLVSGVFGLGILLVARGLVPPRTDLAAAVGRWEFARSQASRSGGTSLDRTERTGRWVLDHLTRRGVDLSSLRADLLITERTPEAWFGRLALTVLAGLFMPALLGALAAAAGLGIGLAIPTSAGLLLASFAAANELAQLRKEARTRREELLQALATYLDLFGMCLMGKKSVHDAMVMSAKIGRGWAFELIQNTVKVARLSRIPAWQAFGELGADVGLQELVDLGSALSLVGDSGARVRASLAARASTLRRRQLAEAASAAVEADDSMRVSQLLMAAGFMLLIGFPAVINILAI